MRTSTCLYLWPSPANLSNSLLVVLLDCFYCYYTIVTVMFIVVFRCVCRHSNTRTRHWRNCQLRFNGTWSLEKWLMVIIEVKVIQTNSNWTHTYVCSCFDVSTGKYFWNCNTVEWWDVLVKINTQKYHFQNDKDNIYHQFKPKSLWSY